MAIVFVLVMQEAIPLRSILIATLDQVEETRLERRYPHAFADSPSLDTRRSAGGSSAICYIFGRSNAANVDGFRRSCTYCLRAAHDESASACTRRASRRRDRTAAIPHFNVWRYRRA